MTRTRTPGRRGRVALRLAIGLALGFSAYQGLRSVELSDATPAVADDAPTTR